MKLMLPILHREEGTTTTTLAHNDANGKTNTTTA
jgi:hypothetical protein